MSRACGFGFLYTNHLPNGDQWKITHALIKTYVFCHETYFLFKIISEIKDSVHSVKVKVILVSHVQYIGRGAPISGTCALTDLSAGLSEPSRLPFPTTCTLDDEYALPMQLTASQVYVPRDVGSSGLAVSANTSPALISWPSLYQRSTGVGTPTTLHSSDTVPCSVSNACSSSRNSGALYAFGTGKVRRRRKMIST